MSSIQFTSRIVPTTSDGVLVESKHIKDEVLGKLQADFNYEVWSKLSDLGDKVLVFRGSVLTYENLPGNPKNGDTYNVISSVVLEGKEYSEGTNFTWVDDHWDALGGTLDDTKAKEYTDGKLKEYKEEVTSTLNSLSGRLEEIEETKLNEILQNSKNYTDEQLSETTGWIEVL